METNFKVKNTKSLYLPVETGIWIILKDMKQNVLYVMKMNKGPIAVYFLYFRQKWEKFVVTEIGYYAIYLLRL